MDEAAKMVIAAPSELRRSIHNAYYRAEHNYEIVPVVE
jgi:hypothetical protein